MKNVLILSATLLFAGCGSDSGRSDSDGATPADAADATGTPIRPGLWESTTESQVAGMPPLPANVTRSCVTPEQSQDAAKVFMQDIDGRECSSRSFNMRAGKLNAQMTCTQDGSKTNISVTGTYTADTYDFVTKITGQLVGAEEAMNLISRARARRVGDCDAKQKAAG